MTIQNHAACVTDLKREKGIMLGCEGQMERGKRSVIAILRHLKTKKNISI